MIKFKEKKFSIKDGQFTGVKDLDKIPGVLSTVGKTTITGAAIGGTLGAVSNESTFKKGAVKGGKFGFVAGIILKFFLNYLHKPMKQIKYQKVDKYIRKEFGIYRMSGVTVRDTLDRRAGVDERFEFNGKDITSFKINVAIYKNKVTLYTLGMTDYELDTVSRILDYYCKTYFGMNYTSQLINAKVNAYSVNVIFTNYKVISSFLLELSKSLNIRINLLNDKAIVDDRFGTILESPELRLEERDFSVKSFNKFDILKILGKSGKFFISNIGFGINSKKEAMSAMVMGLILAGIDKMSNDELVKLKITSSRDNFNNTYLEDTLKRLRYVEGYDYTVGKSSDIANMSLVGGRFILTALKSSDVISELDNIWSKFKKSMNRVDTGGVIVYSYDLTNKSEFDLIIKKLMSLDFKINIFEG